MADGPQFPQGESEQDREERLRQEELTRAYALFEKHPDLAGVLVEIHDKHQELDQAFSPAARERLSEARLEHCLKELEIVARAYLRLVTDFESAKAFNPILYNYMLKTWDFFAGFSIQTIPPTPIFPASPPPPACLQRDKMVNLARIWQVNGFRRVNDLRKAATDTATEVMPMRRGYRSEVKAWMKRVGIETIPQAAKRLALSKSALKSIMSDKGDQRYGPETLERVLKAICSDHAKGEEG